MLHKTYVIFILFVAKMHKNSFDDEHELMKIIIIERKEAFLFHTITKNNSNIIHNVEAKKMCIAPLQKL